MFIPHIIDSVQSHTPKPKRETLPRSAFRLLVSYPCVVQSPSAGMCVYVQQSISNSQRILWPNQQHISSDSVPVRRNYSRMWSDWWRRRRRWWKHAAKHRTRRRQLRLRLHDNGAFRGMARKWKWMSAINHFLNAHDIMIIHGTNVREGCVCVWRSKVSVYIVTSWWRGIFARQHCTKGVKFRKGKLLSVRSKRLWLLRTTAIIIRI